MRCPKCQVENPEGKKFCSECGSDLMSACPRFSSEILPSDKLCGACGYDLRTARSTEADGFLKQARGPWRHWDKSCQQSDALKGGDLWTEKHTTGGYS